jgi:hypothetical protein
MLEAARCFLREFLLLGGDEMLGSCLIEGGSGYCAIAECHLAHQRLKIGAVHEYT